MTPNAYSLPQTLPVGVGYDPDVEARNAELLDAVDREYSGSATPGLGARLTAVEIESLLLARGDSLEAMLLLASRMRDDGLERAGRPKTLTFSKKVFLPITNLCRDRCHYCTFVQSPGQLKKQAKPLYMSADQIVAIAAQGAAMGCKEALFTLGDRPEDRWPEAREWLDSRGYESTLHYVRDMAELVRQETGLLPHLNPGVMTAAELAWLRPVAPSMGMMLETTSHELWAVKGRAHYGSPDKEPSVRLQVLEDAGTAKVPLTTGILVGIGETDRDRAESLLAIRDSHLKHGHIQEVIVQNFRAKPATAMHGAPDLGFVEYLAAVATARLVLGTDVRIQVPPNLADDASHALLVRAGIDDWGGISPLTADHVNPERPWPSIANLEEKTVAAGYALRERLTVYPDYIHEASTWIDPRLLGSIAPLVDTPSGLATEQRPPAAHKPGPGAPGARKSGGRTMLGIPTAPGASVQAALRRAELAPAALNEDDYALLMAAQGDDLDSLAALADNLRRYTVGESISVVVNRNLSSSLLAATARPGGVTLGDVQDAVRDAVSLGATELCLQGTIPADQPATLYLDAIRSIREAAPGMHIHAYRPADIVDGARRLGLAVEDYLLRLKDAGVDTVPGTGVKLLDEEHRSRVAPEDLAAPEWVSAISAAHRTGFKSTSVMVYGLGETAGQRVAHLKALVGIQEQTGGFNELVLMEAQGSEQSLVPGRSRLDEHRAVFAVSRLITHGSIKHIQAPWTRLDTDTVVEMMRCGANDLGGTLLDGRVVPWAGAEHGRELTWDTIRAMERRLLRPVRRRTTSYGTVDGTGPAVRRG
jgi:7,8-didemethyl-8-hydroxy-5-deazariboflavin synthase CofG subunit